MKNQEGQASAMTIHATAGVVVEAYNKPWHTSGCAKRRGADDLGADVKITGCEGNMGGILEEEVEAPAVVVSITGSGEVTPSCM